MSKARDWQVIRDRWSSDFRTIRDALTMALKEQVSKQTRKRLELSFKITNEHRKVVLGVIETAQSMDRTLHGSDFAVERRE